MYIPLQIFQMFPAPVFFVYGIGLFIQYYTVNYEEYHTGVMRTSLGGIGLTECQLFLVFILFLEGFTAGGFSQTSVQEAAAYFVPSLADGMKDKLISVMQMA
mmetsp:Transcript_31433/g.48051  ORF Transcript_31433/g.48051 Transcript_31433/m.48051 type:complete len:102 (+) Transcript_31433:393-698(+)